MICKRCDHGDHANLCMVSIGLPGDYQPCGCQPESRPAQPETATHVRTSRGVIHALTVGREYTDQGRRLTNIAGFSMGKADCGAITSGAGIVTDEPANCPRCTAKA